MFAISHARILLIPIFLLALIMHSCIEIQYGGQQIVFTVATAARFVQKDGLKYSVFKLPLGILYVFRK